MDSTHTLALCGGSSRLAFSERNNEVFSSQLFLSLAAETAALPLVSRIARAQVYPSRSVRGVVGFTAGGIVDACARLIAQWLSERLGQQFVIENRAGAGGNLATELVVNSPRDGYMLLMINPTNTISVELYEKLKFNFINDTQAFTAILHPSWS